MSIQTAIFQRLAQDADLKTFLATSTIDPTQPAIYEIWALADTQTPYINLTYSHIQGNHWAKRDTDLSVDIFSNQDSTHAEAIRNRIIKILDRQLIDLEDGSHARVHYDSDGLMAEPNPEMTHWGLSFSIYYFQTTYESTT